MNWIPGFPHEMPLLIQDSEQDVYVWLSKDHCSKFDSCSIFAAMCNKMSIFPPPSTMLYFIPPGYQRAAQWGGEWEG